MFQQKLESIVCLGLPVCLGVGVFRMGLLQGRWVAAQSGGGGKSRERADRLFKETLKLAQVGPVVRPVP